MANCLVTGGGGFIGSHLTEALLHAGHRVRVIDNFSTGKHANLQAIAEQIELVDGNVTDPEAVDRAVAGVEWIFHLAALPSVHRSVEDPVASHEACATGTLRVLDGARRAGVRRLVYAASSSAYGDNPGAVRRESELVSPLSPYAAAKLAGDFGPRQDPSSPYSGVIAVFIKTMLEGRRPTIYGDGLQGRDFTYVGNAVQALLESATAPAASGKVYNIGTGGMLNLLELVRHLNECLGTSLEPIFAPARAGDVRQSQADITHARNDLSYEPSISFVEGLRLTIASQRA
jgi:UDP-glucose 4-epimerase